MKLDYKVGEVECSYKSFCSNPTTIQTANDAWSLMKSTYPEGQIDYKEYFKVIYMNNACKVLAYTQISSGGLTETSVDIRLVLQAALLTNSTCMILVHNHPSGKLTPSNPDKELTKRIVDAARIMNIRVIDHVIISKDDYLSFSEQGYL